MNTPIILALLALVTIGIHQFFWKIAGVNQTYGPSYMIVETLAFGIVAVIIHIWQSQPFNLSPRMMWLAALGGTLSGIAIFSMLLAFRLGGEGSILYPIIGLSVMISVILAFVIYREPITYAKLLGLGFGVTSIIFLSR